MNHIPESKRGFTLIEMMIVVIIIGLLAGFIFRMMGTAGRGNSVAETRAKLEKVANALEEFRAIYGKYPPVSVYDGNQPMSYEFPMKSSFGSSEAAADAIARQIVNGKDSKKMMWDTGGAANNSGVLFTFGLASFFLPRYNGMADQGPLALLGVKNSTQYSDNAVDQWGNFNKKTSGTVGDSDRDLNAVRKILPHLDASLNAYDKLSDYGIFEYVHHQERYITTSAYKGYITNRVYTIKDAWDRDLRYHSLPPYDTYRLWSVGPDGVSGTSDDLISGVN